MRAQTTVPDQTDHDRGRIRRALLPAGLAGLVALSACAVAPPPGPSILAQPGKGKTEQQFEADDAHCRAYAAQANGGVTPAQAAANSGLGSAAIGTLLGAAAGALLGAAAGNAGAGAAIGGGTGLLFGGAAGSDAAARSGASFQANYDNAYAQCTRATGNLIVLPPVVGYVGPTGPGAYAPALIGPPGPPDYPPPPPPAPGYAY